MSKVTVALTAVAVIVTMVVAGVVILDLSEETNTYSITYELDGETNSDDNPTSYVSGRVTQLYNPISTDRYFSGWYLDAGFTEKIEYISADMTGDITLYASWSESLVGNGFTLSISGTQTSFPLSYIITGYTTYKYLSTNGEAYFMERITDRTYYNLFYSSSQYYDDLYWSDENEGEYTTEQLDNETIDTVYGEVECEVYKYVGPNYVQYEYVYNGWIPCIIEYTKTDSSAVVSMTMTLTEVFTFTPSDNYNVSVVCDENVTATGYGNYAIGSTVTLTASATNGSKFTGWYNEAGMLVSSDSTYTIKSLCADTVLYAMNDTDPDRTIESGDTSTFVPNIGLTDTVWSVYNTDTDDLVYTYTGEKFTYTFGTAGFYDVEYTGNDASGTVFSGFVSLLVTGLMDKTYDWECDGIDYTYTLSIDYEDFLAYRNDTISRSQGSDSHDLEFITYNDPYVVKMAEDFTEMTDGMSDLQVANFVLTFTQYIEYQLDSEYMGVDEYWKFPLETLFDQGGDCEDTSILFCAITKAMGMETALILFPGHATSGIAVDGCSGYGFTARATGITYYYCETTATGWDVGENPNERSYNTQTITNLVRVV